MQGTPLALLFSLGLSLFALYRTFSSSVFHLCCLVCVHLLFSFAPLSPFPRPRFLQLCCSSKAINSKAVVLACLCDANSTSLEAGELSEWPAGGVPSQVEDILHWCSLRTPYFQIPCKLHSLSSTIPLLFYAYARVCAGSDSTYRHEDTSGRMSCLFLPASPISLQCVSPCHNALHQSLLSLILICLGLYSYCCNHSLLILAFHLPLVYHL